MAVERLVRGRVRGRVRVRGSVRVRGRVRVRGSVRVRVRVRVRGRGRVRVAVECRRDGVEAEAIRSVGGDEPRDIGQQEAQHLGLGLTGFEFGIGSG